MSKVKFLQDFQGVETNNVFYLRGQVVDVSEGVASRCVADGRAENTTEDLTAPEPAAPASDPDAIMNTANQGVAGATDDGQPAPTGKKGRK